MNTSTLDHVRIVLSHTSHPGNIGAAARAMKTMGLSRLVLVNPQHFPDAQATAMAAGATDVLERAQVCGSLEEALSGTTFATAMTARRRGLAVEPLWAREAAAELAVLAGKGEVAVVFGNETAGLSNEEVSLCMRWAKIPSDPDWSSLNLAQAVQVVCYELRMTAVDAGEPPAINDAGLPATHEEVEGLMGHLERAAVGSGFLDPAQPKRLIPRMRRLFSRARLEKEEVAILRGMLSAFETGPYRKRD
ncbi:MAG TPA: RNA methyltransferase [Rhodocyclaceae bacterium]